MSSGRTPAEGAAARQHSPHRAVDVIVETLLELGVDTFYGIPGGAISPVYDALLAHPEARIITTRHETGAAFMAIGHARMGGSLPCVLMTSGPGITNALTGLAAAAVEGVPLIAIGGEVPRSRFGHGALQEGSSYQLNIVGMVRSIAKLSAEITLPDTAAMVVRKAVATALSGRRGPVFLTLPLDVANAPALPTLITTRVQTSFELDAVVLAEAAAAITRARRPVLLVGSGARQPESVRLVRAVAERLQIPVITSPKAKGILPESHPLALGVFGYGGHPSATSFLEQGVDVVLCVGAGLGETSTNNWSRLLQASDCFIQIDIDSAQIARNYRVDIGLIGPADRALGALLERLPEGPTPRRTYGIRRSGAAHVASNEVPLHPARVVRLLQEHMPANTVFTSDIGEHLLFAIHHLSIELPDAFIANVGLGSMGSGLGSAIGAKVACPDRPVVAICGDHSFQMYGMELATCVQNRIGVVFAVFNDARMNMVESGFLKVYGRAQCVSSQRIDVARLASALGAHGFHVRTADDLAVLPRELLCGDIPTVLDIETDGSASFGLAERDAALKHFDGG
jgi:acetolactate synthase-1/2/3 large subunit